MTPISDIIKPKWERLMKKDGHLGGLYDAKRGIIRFIGGGGTIEYDLAAMTAEALQEEAKQPTS